jgi:hypothetical protein
MTLRSWPSCWCRMAATDRLNAQVRPVASAMSASNRVPARPTTSRRHDDLWTYCQVPSVTGASDPQQVLPSLIRRRVFVSGLALGRTLTKGRGRRPRPHALGDGGSTGKVLVELTAAALPSTIGGTEEAALTPWRLRPLLDSSVSIRKVCAKSLIGNLTLHETGPALDLFSQEKSPEVIKWLAMALARTANISCLSGLRKKRADCVDMNALDWLVAAEAVLEPLTARAITERHLRSGDSAVRAGLLRSRGMAR